MKKAIVVIAVCEVIRTIQITIDIVYGVKEHKARMNSYAEFVDSLKAPEKDFVERLLREFGGNKEI